MPGLLARLRSRLTPSLLWDGFMVYLATLNLLLIGFDLSYRWLRPAYVRRLPLLARLYDPVRGLAPHPLAGRYLAAVEELDTARRAGWTLPLAAAGDRLAGLGEELLGWDPFAQGPRGGREAVLASFAAAGGEPAAAAADPEAARRLLAGFWRAEPAVLASRLAAFRRDIAPRFAAAAYRARAPDGEPVDRFWLLDLPFLLLFAGDFVVRWGLAARRDPRRWYHFPLFNWYDALGLVPAFRFFRLLRLVSIYLRLARSERSRVGSDPVSRAVKRLAGVVTEELSDLVTLRILTSAQEKVREGVYADILRRSLAARRVALREELAAAAARLLASEELRRGARDLLRLHLEQALSGAEALRRLPVPDAVVQRLARGLGLALYDSLVATVAGTLASQAGSNALGRVVDTVADALLAGAAAGSLEAILQEVSLDILERTKDAVALREWAGERWTGPLREIATGEAGGPDLPAGPT